MSQPYFPKPSGPRPAPSPDDPAVRARFLEAIEKLGVLSAAAALSGVPLHRFYLRRDKDSQFADAWDDAILLAHGSLEALLHERFVNGVEHKLWKDGKLVSETRRYSDALGIYRHKVLEKRVEKIEDYRLADERRRRAAAATREMSDEELVRRIAWILNHPAAQPILNGEETLDGPVGDNATSENAGGEPR